MARDVVARIDAWQAVANIQGRAADPFALLGFSDGHPTHQGLDA